MEKVEPPTIQSKNNEPKNKYLILIFSSLKFIILPKQSINSGFMKTVAQPPNNPNLSLQYISLLLTLL